MPPAFLRDSGRVVAFGFALAFLSSFGQTYFIALTSPGVREAFDLSHTGFGTLYAAATTCSGLLMIWAGGVLDRVSLKAYTLVAIAGLALSALAMSLVTSVALLALTLFGLRLFGQGMLGHAAITTPARLVGGVRGRATALSAFGFTAGEGLLPLAAVAILAIVAWRDLWQMAGALLAVAFVLVALVGADRPGRPAAAPAGTPAPAPIRRRDVLRHPAFLIFLPAIAAPGALVTGLFFHQRAIAEASGWPLPLLAGSITVFALAAVAGSFAAGALVDRIGALRVSRVHLLPLAGAGLALAVAEGPLAAPLVFGLAGLTAGAQHVVAAAVMAELFGTATLGAIRALGSAVVVLASATTPALAGLVLDAGASLAWLGLPAAAWAILASLLDLRLRRFTAIA